jgi:hypothetical protein
MEGEKAKNQTQSLIRIWQLEKSEAHKEQVYS